ncbi:hypothetical protein RQP46_008101 [Phenoliferia psychrophenolica]
MIGDMEPASAAPYFCFGCGAVEAVVGQYLLCSACRKSRYCTPACQKTDWKKHKPTCQIFVKELNNFETKMMAAPKSGALYSAANFYIETSLFIEISAYLARVLYRFGDAGPRLETTHVIYLGFTFHPNRSERHGRRAQFELTDGGIVTYQKMGELARGSDRTGEGARDRREYISRLKNGLSRGVPANHALGTVVVVLNTEDPFTIPQTLTTRTFYGRYPPIPIAHSEGWLGFAKEAF